MEDIIKALLDVVRIQHGEADGTEVEPFNMEDIVDMAMNIIGRPEEAGEERALIKEIEGTVETMAPDLFPPKTFDQLEDSEQLATASSMIEKSLLSGMRQRGLAGQLDTAAAGDGSGVPGSEEDETEAAARTADVLSQIDAYNRMNSESEEEEEFNAGEAADLNTMIYDNIMKMMGLTEPKVEDAFDRSQIRFGKEKTVTELLEEERQNQSADHEGSAPDEPARQLSAWELAQNAIDKDIEAHTKEEYVPKPMEMPTTTSASQLAAEAIARAKEEDNQKSEIEKRAEALMEEARRLGKNPMEFALHQQEILRYMEKNSDELVSFEDYEDLSPEEKYEIEQAIEAEKRQEEEAARAAEAGAPAPEAAATASGQTDPAEADERAPVVTDEKDEVGSDGTDNVGSDGRDNVGADGRDNVGSDGRDNAGAVESQSADAGPVLTEEMLRQLSSEVIRENSEQILADNADEDMESLNDIIMENIRKMMGSTGVPVHQESVDSLIDQVISGSGGGGSAEAAGGQDRERARESGAEQTSGPAPEQASEQASESASEPASEAKTPGTEASSAASSKPADRPFGTSAADLARAAQEAAGIKRQEEIEETTVSAVELAKIAQEAARRLKEAEEAGEKAIDLDEEDLDFDIPDFDPDEETSESPETETAGQEAETAAGADSEEEGSEDEADSEEEGSTAAAEAGSKEEASAAGAGLKEEASAAGAGLKEEISASEDGKEEDTSADEKDSAKAASEKETEEDKSPEIADIDDFEDESPSYVLGEHTQAEIDEALRNLETLGLEGEVYDRAERLLLLEMAESEEELDAWLASRDGSEEIPDASPLYDDSDTDLTDLDADEMEMELDLAIEEEFDSEEEEAAGGESDSDLATETEAAEEPAADPAEQQTSEAEAESAETREEAAVDPAAGAADEPEAGSPEEKPAEPAEELSDKAAEKAADGQEDEPADESGTETGDAAKAEGKEEGGEQNQELQVSVRSPFILKNSAGYMDQFEDYIMETQENRRLSTGFAKLDGLLRYGLHKGSYFIDSDPQYLKNAFVQQIADRTAENGIDVLFISTELSRYDLMVESVSRLSYEIHGKNGGKASSPMDIMSGREGANLIDLKDELNWYRGRISEHLFIVDHEAVLEMAESAENDSAGMILEDLIRSIVREGAHKPVVVIDNLENVLVSQDPEDMVPFMAGMKKLASELGIPILMSYGYAQAESEYVPDAIEKDLRRTLGNMCDVYLDVNYANMITEDGAPLTGDDILEMAENGEPVLVDVFIRRNRRAMRASCQIQSVPKYNWFTE